MVSLRGIAAASAPGAEKAPKLAAHPHENAVAVEVGRKKRGRNYGKSQIAITAAPIHKGCGYKQTLSDNKDAGFSLYEMKDAVNRLKANDTDSARIPGTE